MNSEVLLMEGAKFLLKTKILRKISFLSFDATQNGPALRQTPVKEASCVFRCTFCPCIRRFSKNIVCERNTKTTTTLRNCDRIPNTLAIRNEIFDEGIFGWTEKQQIGIDEKFSFCNHNRRWTKWKMREKIFTRQILMKINARECVSVFWGVKNSHA